MVAGRLQNDTGRRVAPMIVIVARPNEEGGRDSKQRYGARRLTHVAGRIGSAELRLFVVPSALFPDTASPCYRPSAAIFESR